MRLAIRSARAQAVEDHAGHVVHELVGCQRGVAGRYHSMMELIIPNMSLVVTEGRMSLRKFARAGAQATRSATR